MYSLEDKVAVITGAGSKQGIGRAIAIRLAQEGANIIAVDKDALLPHDRSSSDDWRGIQSLVGEVENIGRQALAVVCDISKSAEVDNMVKETIVKMGKIDILVNNAGIHIYSGIEDITDEIWNKHIDVNLTGTFFCARAVAREMLKRGKGGKIINIASLLGKTGATGGQLAYSVSKFGVIGLTQCLALELAPHKILVNAVCPTLTDTDIHTNEFKIEAKSKVLTVQEFKDQMYKKFASQIPLGRLSTTEDTANMVAFLASDQASFIVGQSINVNGGFFTAL